MDAKQTRHGKVTDGGRAIERDPQRFRERLPKLLKHEAEGKPQ